MSRTTVATHLANELPRQGVTHVFELVGGMITVLLDALHAQPDVSVISVHHEQAAGFAAEGFARMSGGVSVALATSGPGATNLLTAIGSSYFDSVPVVFITGQVNRAEIHTPGQGRQGGFQETDIVSMAAPVTKGAWLVDEVDRFPEMLDAAFALAREGRPGPVLLDVPMDVQRAELSREPSRTTGPVSERGSEVTAAPIDAFIKNLREALMVAQRPLIIAGGGIRSAGAVGVFRDCVEAWGIPTVTSLLGLDALPSGSPLRVGLIGSYGNRWANWAVSQADLLLVLGSRPDVRQTGSDIVGFRGDRRVFHVDIDPSELNHHVTGCETLASDVGRFLASSKASLTGAFAGSLVWTDKIRDRGVLWPDTAENVPATGVNPNELMHDVSELWTDVSAFVTDVGQHQMWAAQSLHLGAHQRFLTSGGMGSMGFGLPVSIGAALAADEAPTCLVAGDGGFQCNIQELQTAKRLGANVRMVILDNGSHGMVRQFQQSYFDGRYHSTKWGYSAPDFLAVANAYGIPAYRVEDRASVRGVLTEVAALPSGPSLIHVPIDPELNAYPKMAFGQPFGSMEPQVSPLEMEGT